MIQSRKKRQPYCLKTFPDKEVLVIGVLLLVATIIFSLGYKETSYFLVLVTIVVAILFKDHSTLKAK